MHTHCPVILRLRCIHGREIHIPIALSGCLNQRSQTQTVAGLTRLHTCDLSDHSQTKVIIHFLERHVNVVMGAIGCPHFRLIDPHRPEQHLLWPPLTGTHFTHRCAIIFKFTFTNTTLMRSCPSLSSNCRLVTVSLQMLLRRLRPAEHRRSSCIPSCRSEWDPPPHSVSPSVSIRLTLCAPPTSLCLTFGLTPPYPLVSPSVSCRLTVHQSLRLQLHPPPPPLLPTFPPILPSCLGQTFKVRLTEAGAISLTMLGVGMADVTLTLDLYFMLHLECQTDLYLLCRSEAALTEG